MPDPEELVAEDIVMERIRLLIIGIGIALNVAIVYWQLKDTAPMIELRGRLRNLRARMSHPWHQAKSLRRAEGETVWEAIQVVEGR